MEIRNKTYHVIQSPVADRVENTANKMMEDGWMPCGGINVLRCWRYGFVYTQAMVLPTPATEKKE